MKSAGDTASQLDLSKHILVGDIRDVHELEKYQGLAVPCFCWAQANDFNDKAIFETLQYYKQFKQVQQSTHKFDPQIS